MYDREAANKETWDRRFPTFKAFQKALRAEKLGRYSFVVNISDPNEERLKTNHINTGDGFECAHIYYKGVPIAYVYPQFPESWKKEQKIEGMWIRLNWKDVLESVNWSRCQRKMEELKFEMGGHQTLQSCLDEIEKVRTEIVNHFTP